MATAIWAPHNAASITEVARTFEQNLGCPSLILGRSGNRNPFHLQIRAKLTHREAPGERQVNAKRPLADGFQPVPDEVDRTILSDDHVLAFGQHEPGLAQGE